MEFRILGPLEAHSDGEPLRLGGAKQQGLLAILLLHAGEVVSSDRLIDALWGEAPPQTARKALQVHISQLRKVLEPERESGRPGRVLVTRPPGYLLALEPEQLDLTRFDRLASEGREALASGEPQRAAALLTEALSLWRGPPLAEIAFPFVQPEIARLEELRQAALEDRIQADLDRGHHVEVVGELEGLVAAEPLRERLWGQLLHALYRSGRQADALGAYQRARDALVEELGIEPGKQLRSLHAAILRQDPALDPTGDAAIEPGSTAAGATADPAADERRRTASGFVGRERELAELEAALEGARAGHGSTYLVGGGPGIGKSRLADELAGLARPRGVRVLWGRCWEAGGAPAYWPWVQALRTYIAEADANALRLQLGPRGPEITQLLPELRDRFPDLAVPTSPESEGARFRLFDAAAAFIKQAAEDAPLLLVLDDLHAADTPSLLMLSFIAGEIADAAVLVVGTYRDVEIRPRHPLNSTLTDFARQHAAHLISLEGLDEAEVSQLIEASAEIVPSRRGVAAIHRGTNGNPLFVQELVHLLMSENRLEEAGGEGAARVRIPRGVQEVIGRRLEIVSGECRRILGVASVLGRDFDLDLLAEVTGRRASELIDVLDQAIDERIVLELPGIPDRLRFSHVLIRDVLYEELGASRRRHLHDRAGEALEALHSADADPHLAELAHHYFEAGSIGDPVKALEYARRAGDRASRQLAHEEAARLYELGIRVLRTARPADEAIRCELSLALADARLRAGDDEQAKATFLAAAEIARRLGDADTLGQAALGYGGRYVWMAARGDPHLIPLLEEALASLPGSDSALRAKLVARLACAVRDQPDRDRRLPLSEQAVAMADRLDDPRTLAYALGARCTAMIDPRSMEGFTDTAREAIRVGEAVGEIEWSFMGRFYLLIPLLETGDIPRAEAILLEMTREAEELREPAYRWGAAGVRAALALFEGRFDAAEELISSAYEIGREAQPFNSLASHTLQRFMLRRERGGLEDVEHDLRKGVADYPTYHVWRCALATLHAEMGHEAAARAVFDEVAAGDFETVHFDEEFLGSMTFLADACRALADVERAQIIYQRILPYGDRNAFAMPELILGSLSRPLGVLATMLGRPDEAAEHLERAIVMNEQMDARPWVAHAKFDLGRALARPGRDATVRSTELFEDALGEYRRLGMGPWERKAGQALAGLGTPSAQRSA